MRARRPRTRHARGSIILHFAIERSIVVRLSWLKPWLRSGKPCGLDQPGAPGTGKGEGHASPAGASTRSGRALARTSESRSTMDDGAWLLSDRHARRSPHWERARNCACPRRFNLYENRYIYSKTIISGLLSARTGRRVRHGRREQASRQCVFAVDFVPETHHPVLQRSTARA